MIIMLLLSPPPIKHYSVMILLMKTILIPLVVNIMLTEAWISTRYSTTSVNMFAFQCSSVVGNRCSKNNVAAIRSTATKKTQYPILSSTSSSSSSSLSSSSSRSSPTIHTTRTRMYSTKRKIHDQRLNETREMIIQDNLIDNRNGRENLRGGERLAAFRQRQWEKVFQRLLIYKDHYGHTNVPEKYNDGGSPSLGGWVHYQRTMYRILKNGGDVAYGQQRIDQLNAIGFEWQLGHLKDDTWMANFINLKEFKAKYNSTKVPVLDSNSIKNDPISPLGQWVQGQRKYYKRLDQNKTSQMTLKRKELLDSIGFEGTGRRHTDHEKWLGEYFKLYYYWYQYNTTHVSDSDGVNAKLIKWIKQQKKSYHNKRLPQGKVDLLNEIGFDWTIPPPPTWDEMFDELKAYHSRFGSTLINSNINPVLSSWTTRQRIAYAEDEVSIDKCRKLNNLGFDWNFHEDEDWHAMADRFVAYKKKYNTTNVPRRDGDDRPLGNWVSLQRDKYASYFENSTAYDENLIQKIAVEKCHLGSGKKVYPETVASRVYRLLDIGFIWDPLEDQWTEMYNRLIAYKEKHSTTNAPKTYKDDPELSSWVKFQRSLRGERKYYDEYPQKRIDLLDAIGFEWDPHKAAWDEMYKQLLQYKEKYGTTRVDKSHPKLADWVYLQRYQRKVGLLSEERVKLLDTIGFVWQVHQGTK